MPCGGVHTSREERQRIRQSYHATSEKEAGVAHLWHLQQLADIRLNPSHTIQDAPDVDFQSPTCAADMYKDLFAQRYAQQVRHDEAKVYEQNKMVYRNIISASDDEARRARHMNLVPTEDQVKRFDNIQQQTLHRTQDRERRQRVLDAENKKLLEHLISVPPHVRTAKELDTWYHTVHQKRLAQLSRFKPAEQYAGARLLEGTAAYAAVCRSASPSAQEGPERRTRDYGAASPLVRGQPYPPSAPFPDSADASRRSSRRPQWRSIAATDIPQLHYDADQRLRGNFGSSNGGSTPQRRHGTTARSLAQTQREASPSSSLLASSAENVDVWNAAYNVHVNAAINDHSHHSSHKNNRSSGVDGNSSRRSGQSVRRVTAQEEGGVTRLWRRAVQDRHNYTSSATSAGGRPARATCAVEGEGSAPGDDRATPSIQSRKSARQPSPDDASVAVPRQRRLSKKSVSPATSARPPLAAARAAPSVDRRSPDEAVPHDGNTSPATDDDDGDGEGDAAAAVQALMEGWSWRSKGGGGRAYAPI